MNAQRRFSALARWTRRTLPTLLSLFVVFSLLFADFSHALPPGLTVPIPSGSLLSARVQLELTRLGIQLDKLGLQLDKLGLQSAQAQGSNPPFSQYWMYGTGTSPAISSNDGYAVFFVPERNRLFVGTASGIAAIDFLTNTLVASYALPNKVNAIHAAGGEVAVATDGSGAYVFDEGLNLTAHYTQPTLYNVLGDYVSDVALIKSGGFNLLAVTGYYISTGVTVIDRNLAQTYYYRMPWNGAQAIDVDLQGLPDLYVAYNNGGYPGGVVKIPYLGNGYAVSGEQLGFQGIDGYGRYVYTSNHTNWLYDRAPTTTPQAGDIDYAQGLVYYGANPGPTVLASYDYWEAPGASNSTVAGKYWSNGSSPALPNATSNFVMWHAPTQAFYSVEPGHWFFGGASVTRIQNATATVYTPSTAGLSGSGGVFKKVAKQGDDLYIATNGGISRLNESSGQGTIANSGTINDWRYDVRDLALDGPVVFTADADHGTEILYRGSAQDTANRLGRGTCDTRPLLSNEVSACNGNSSYTETDLVVPGKGLPTAFIRSYNDQDNRQGPLGPGWTYTFDAAITFNPFNTVAIVRRGDGRRDKYQKDANGNYTGQVGVYDTLVRNGNGTYTLTEKDQTKLNFTSNGRLDSVVDRNGNATTTTYNGSGNLTLITDSAGRSFSLAYNGSGRLTSITDPINRVWTYAYDGSGRLQSVTNPLNGVTTYGYDGANHLLTVTDPRNNVVQTNTYFSWGQLDQKKDALNNATTYWIDLQPFRMTVTDARGKNTTYTMDDLGRTTKITDHAGHSLEYTYHGETTLRATMKDRRGNVTWYTWDSRGNLLTVTDPLSHTTTLTYNASNFLTSVTDALGRTTTYSYDSQGNLTGILDPTSHTWALGYNGNGLVTSITDPLNHATTFGYDAQGNRTSITDALNKTTTLSYDGVGRRTSISDRNSHTTTYQYDVLSRITKVTNAMSGERTTAYDANGNVLTSTDQLNRATTATYDARNLRTSSTNALNGVTNYQYDSVGHLIQITDPMNFGTSYQYDDLNRVSQITDPTNAVIQFGYDVDGNRTSVTDPLNHMWAFTYDANSRLLTASDPLNHVSTFAYDANGNRTSITDPLNRVTNYSYDAMSRIVTTTNPLNQVTTYAYDVVGNPVSLTDARNNTMTFGYDARNSLVSVSDALNRSMSFGYDNAGNRTSITDPLSNVSTLTYDALNRVTEVKDPLLLSMTFDYDAIGNLLTTTDPLNHADHYMYDGLNRLTRITDAQNNQTNLTYDANSRLTSITDAINHTTSYTYNNRGQFLTATNPLNLVWGRTYDASGRTTSTTDPKNQTTTYAYDNANRLTSLTHAGMSATTFGYNAASALTSMVDSTGTTTYTLDALYRPTSIAVPDGQGGTKTVGYGYDAVGNRTSLTYPDSKQVTYSYNAANQLSGVTDWSNGITTIQYDNKGRRSGITLANGASQNYAYDNADRLTNIFYAAASATPIGSIAYTYDNADRLTSLSDAEGTTNFGYDSLNRLTSAAYPSSTPTTYSYDAVGNRTSQTVNGTTTNYTYDAADRLTQAGSTNYGYDNNGNLTSRGSDSFTWDSADRLISATVGSNSASMAYDGSNHLVAKTVGGNSTRYVYDRSLPMSQLLTDGSSTYQFGPGMSGGFGPIMEETGGTKHWLQNDQLGSSRYITDATGSAVSSSTYDAFGGPRQQNGTQSNFRFAGQENHGDLGLLYMRSRWYDPGAGRFISPDAMAGSVAAPQSLNAYTYVQNSPCNSRDPSGLSIQGGGRTGVSGVQGSGFGAGAALRPVLQSAVEGIPLSTDILNDVGVNACQVAPAPDKAQPIVSPSLSFVLSREGALGQQLASVFSWPAIAIDAVQTWLGGILALKGNPPNVPSWATASGSCVASKNAQPDWFNQFYNDPNKPFQADDCRTLWELILEAIDELASRFYDMVRDPGDFYPRRFSQPDWDGHQYFYEHGAYPDPGHPHGKDRLRDLRQSWDDKCFDGPTDGYARDYGLLAIDHYLYTRPPAQPNKDHPENVPFPNPDPEFYGDMGFYSRPVWSRRDIPIFLPAFYLQLPAPVLAPQPATN